MNERDKNLASTPRDQADQIFDDDLCRRIDSVLEKKLNNQSVSRGTLIRRLYPVIQKYRQAGLTLDDIANALQDEGYDLNRGHLAWHLGIIKREIEAGKAWSKESGQT